MVMLTHETEGIAVNAKCQQCRPVGIRKSKKYAGENQANGENQDMATIRRLVKSRQRRKSGHGNNQALDEKQVTCVMAEMK